MKKYLLKKQLNFFKKDEFISHAVGDNGCDVRANEVLMSKVRYKNQGGIAEIMASSLLVRDGAFLFALSPILGLRKEFIK